MDSDSILIVNLPGSIGTLFAIQPGTPSNDYGTSLTIRPWPPLPHTIHNMPSDLGPRFKSSSFHPLDFEFDDEGTTCIWYGQHRIFQYTSAQFLAQWRQRLPREAFAYTSHLGEYDLFIRVEFHKAFTIPYDRLPNFWQVGKAAIRSTGALYSM